MVYKITAHFNIFLFIVIAKALLSIDESSCVTEREDPGHLTSHFFLKISRLGLLTSHFFLKNPLTGHLTSHFFLKNSRLGLLTSISFSRVLSRVFWRHISFSRVLSSVTEMRFPHIICNFYLVLQSTLRIACIIYIPPGRWTVIIYRSSMPWPNWALPHKRIDPFIGGKET
jgi:hypothetical protein